MNKAIIAPMIDRISPAGWNGEPSEGLEKIRAIKPPTIDPTIPRRIVASNPKWTCMINFAINPARNPIMMYQMMCNIIGNKIEKAGPRFAKPNQVRVKGLTLCAARTAAWPTGTSDTNGSLKQDVATQP
jgi:hypothetical protein